MISDEIIILRKHGDCLHLRINGKELTDDFGLNWYEYGWRMYDPQLGQWHSVDPMDEFHSPYCYVGNNPVNFVDPDGTDSDDPSETPLKPIAVDITPDGPLYIFPEIIVTRLDDLFNRTGIDLRLDSHEKQRIMEWTLGFCGGGITKVNRLNATKIFRRFFPKSKKFGWLLEHEGRLGGHVIRDHVGKSIDELKTRLPNVNTSSSFYNQEIAEGVISETLRGNSAHIKQWLLSASPGSTRGYMFETIESIGYGISQGSENIFYMNKAMVVIKAIGKGKYNIHTAYPIK